MTTHIEIRRATASDVPVLALLGRVTYTQDLQAYCNKVFAIDYLQLELSDPKSLYWMAFVDGIPAGFSVLKVDSPSALIPDKKTCQLYKIYVLSDFTSMRIGKQLQEALLSAAKSSTCEEIWVSAYYKNARAIAFYEKNGFNQIGDETFTVEGVNYRQTALSKRL